MDRRRPRLDPEVAEQIRSRLALVLADRLPRRAAARDVGPEPEALAPDDRPLDADRSRNDELPLDDELPPRSFGRRHLKVVAALLVLGLLVTGWSLLRARPVAVAGPAPVVSALAPAPAPTTTASTPDPVRIVVHVLGAVRKPGLVRLPGRSRVQDAIAAAGGLKGSADPGELNLAQVLSDGQQIMIGSRRAPAGEVRDGGSAGGDGGGSGGSSLDLNSATEAQLEELPGIGPVTAARIIAWRTAHNRFSAVKELQEVDGIGPKTYAEIEPHVRV